jgi:hypothetical protein
MELSVSDFAAILQNSPTSGMPQLANPAALAGEIFNHLRGFVERAHYYDNLKPPPLGPADDGNAASAVGGRLAELLGGPAQDKPALADFVPARAGASSASQPVEGNTLADPRNALSDQQRKILVEIERVHEFALAMMNFSVEATLVAGGVTQVVRSVNTLLKAQ